MPTSGYAAEITALPPGNYPLALNANSAKSKPQFMQVSVTGGI